MARDSDSDLFSPAIVEMENTFLAGRITYTDLSQQRLLLDKLSNEHDIIIYEHHERTDNLHIHFLVANPSKSREDTYTKWVKSIVGGDKVSRKYSFKRKDVNIDFISYMSKGKLDPVFVNSINNIFTPAVVEPLKQKGYDKHDKKQEPLTFTVKPRVTEWTMVQEVIAMINPPENIDDLIYTTKEITPAAKKVREKNKRLLSAKQFMEFVQKCKFYLNPGDYDEACFYWDSYLSGKKY